MSLSDHIHSHIRATAGLVVWEMEPEVAEQVAIVVGDEGIRNNDAGWRQDAADLMRAVNVLAGDEAALAETWPGYRPEATCGCGHREAAHRRGGTCATDACDGSVACWTGA